MIRGVRAAVLAVEGVTSCDVVVDGPASIEVIVEGGDEADISAAVNKARSLGVAWRMRRPSSEGVTWCDESDEWRGMSNEQIVASVEAIIDSMPPEPDPKVRYTRLDERQAAVMRAMLVDDELRDMLVVVATGLPLKDPERLEGKLAAVEHARVSGVPYMLDPKLHRVECSKGDS